MEIENNEKEIQTLFNEDTDFLFDENDKPIEIKNDDTFENDEIIKDEEEK